MSRKSLGIYIHIPFCVQKCLYCDFVSGPASIEVKRNYVNCLLKEIDYRAESLCPFITMQKEQDEEVVKDVNLADGYLVDTVFIGGGTPSVLEADLIGDILCKLKERFLFAPDCECSMEVNPGTVDAVKLQKYKEVGINRLSIGLQSCHDPELKALGRIHDYKTFEETYETAKAAGFNNINVDLMSAIPEQTVESFAASLQRIAELSPEHISVYSLIVEEGTPFYDMDLKLPGEEEERQIYHKTGAILKEYGYAQYEISNYAKKGKECKHNIRYWKCEEYVGFGCAAASFVNGVRWKNTEKIKIYMESMQGKFTRLADSDFYCEKEELTQEDKYAEFMFMGLRMNEGVSEDEFCERFGVTMAEKYGEVIDKHIKNNLLICQNNRVMLTEQGRDICNYVMADFLF